MKIREFFDRKWILRGLKKRYGREIEEMKISKDWIKECIIGRKQEFRRKELTTIESQLTEQELFYKWLKKKSIWRK